MGTKSSAANKLLTLPQFGRHLGCNDLWHVHHMIRQGRFRPKRALIRRNGRWFVDIERFHRAIKPKLVDAAGFARLIGKPLRETRGLFSALRRATGRFGGVRVWRRGRFYIDATMFDWWYCR